jgi:ABC-type nickel/cobalt efflux system permease component RcnA
MDGFLKSAQSEMEVVLMLLLLFLLLWMCARMLKGNMHWWSTQEDNASISEQNEHVLGIH